MFFEFFQQLGLSNSCFPGNKNCAAISPGGLDKFLLELGKFLFTAYELEIKNIVQSIPPTGYCNENRNNYCKKEKRAAEYRPKGWRELISSQEKVTILGVYFS